MGFSQADRFEQHVTNQLSKSLGAIPVLMPVVQQLRLREIIDAHCPGRETVSHGTICEVLSLNRLMAPKPLYKVNEWVAETVLEEALGISANQLYDMRLGRTLDDLYPHLGAIWHACGALWCKPSLRTILDWICCTTTRQRRLRLL